MSPHLHQCCLAVHHPSRSPTHLGSPRLAAHQRCFLRLCHRPRTPHSPARAAVKLAAWRRPQSSFAVAPTAFARVQQRQLWVLLLQYSSRHPRRKCAGAARAGLVALRVRPRWHRYHVVLEAPAQDAVKMVLPYRCSLQSDHCHQDGHSRHLRIRWAKILGQPLHRRHWLLHCRHTRALIVHWGHRSVGTLSRRPWCLPHTTAAGLAWYAAITRHGTACTVRASPPPPPSRPRPLQRFRNRIVGPCQ